MKKLATVLVVATLTACRNGGGVTDPTPDKESRFISGLYKDDHTYMGADVQWMRQSDGVGGHVGCTAFLTVSKPSAAPGELSGFLSFSNGCPPQTFDVTGFSFTDGLIRFASGGPKPKETQCPAARNVEYAGTLVFNGTHMQLSARASAVIDCPGEGTYRMVYSLMLYQ